MHLIFLRREQVLSKYAHGLVINVPFSSRKNVWRKTIGKHLSSIFNSRCVTKCAHVRETKRNKGEAVTVVSTCMRYDARRSQYSRRADYSLLFSFSPISHDAAKAAYRCANRARARNPGRAEIAYLKRCIRNCWLWMLNTQTSHLANTSQSRVTTRDAQSRRNFRGWTRSRAMRKISLANDTRFVEEREHCRIYRKRNSLIGFNSPVARDKAMAVTSRPKDWNIILRLLSVSR